MGKRAAGPANQGERHRQNNQFARFHAGLDVRGRVGSICSSRSQRPSNITPTIVGTYGTMLKNQFSWTKFPVSWPPTSAPTMMNSMRMELLKTARGTAEKITSNRFQLFRKFRKP